MKAINLGTEDGLPTIDWSGIAARLEAGARPERDDHNALSTWLTTINEDGSPHLTPVGAPWLDGTFWFQTGAGTVKARNVERDPRCSVGISIQGADVILEGRAERVTDPDGIARAAKAWADGGWPAEVDPSGEGITAPFNAPTQGPPPWHVYRIVPTSALVCLGEEPGGLTRFCF
jgi:hypothetical protein